MEAGMIFTDLTARRRMLTALLASAIAACVMWAPQRASAADSLYQRLGGYDAIAGFVDTAFPRVATHPQLNHLFRGHAQSSQMRQRQLIVDALCQGTGGPCLYTGRDMKGVHVGLGITEAQWEAFMGIISAAATERKFGAAEKAEFLTLFNTRFKPSVVEKP
jgi:hemoglobin